MTQLRFHVNGTPARDSAIEKERPSPSRLSDLHIAAGSAARAAEEEKRFNGSTGNASAGFSLRAQNGRVFRNASLVSSRQDSSVPEDELPHIHASGAAQPTCSREVNLPAAADPGAAELSVPGPLQAAAARVQSLFRKITKSSN